MLNVTARKVRGRRPPPLCDGLVYSGILARFPVVGRSMVIFREPQGLRLTTTAVQRILKDSGNEDVYVETRNSLYRLTVRELSRTCS